MDPILRQRAVEPARRRAKNNLMKAEMHLNNFQRYQSELVGERLETYAAHNPPEYWYNDAGGRPEWFEEYRRDMIRMGRRAADEKAQYLAARKELGEDVGLLHGLRGSRLAKATDEALFRKVRHLDLVYRLRKNGPHTAKLKRYRRMIRQMHLGRTTFTRAPTVAESRARGFCGMNYFFRADRQHTANLNCADHHAMMRFHEGRDIRRERARTDPNMPADRRAMIAAGSDPFPSLEDPHFWHTDDRNTMGLLPKHRLPLSYGRRDYRGSKDHVPPNDYSRD